jgi:Predicted nucleotidyltransferases
MENRLGAYLQSREALLRQITEELSRDERFVAAWLSGSYGRNEADEVSDLDLNLVVADSHSKLLCNRQEQVSHQTTAERLAIFRKFGEIALIHENNNNAPENGTFTFVLYSGSALMVDWVIMPQMNAARPYQSVLLFDKENIPNSSPPTLEELEEGKKAVTEQWAFFWMMAAVTIKYIIRGDSVFVAHWLEELHRVNAEIERRVDRRPRHYHRGSLSQLQSTPVQQIKTIYQLCKRMQTLAPRVEQFSGGIPLLPMPEIETLLSLIDY